jgi:hypothetical protein
MVVDASLINLDPLLRGLDIAIEIKYRINRSTATSIEVFLFLFLLCWDQPRTSDLKHAKQALYH